MDWTSILIGALAGGFVLFLWNGVAWMALPHHHREFVPTPDRDTMEKALAPIEPKGVFHAVPHFVEYDAGMKDPQYQERVAQGPNALIIRQPDQTAGMGKTFLRALVLDFLEAFALAFLLTLVLPGLGDRLSTRLLLFAGLGAFATFPVLANLTLWMGFPGRFALTSTIDKCVGYTLVALTFHLLGTASI